MYSLCFKVKTAYELRISDWSSDVCSSDHLGDVALALFQAAEARLDQSVHRRLVPPVHRDDRQPHLAVHEIGYRARLQYVFALLRQEAVRRGHHGRVDGHGFRIAPSIESGIPTDTDCARLALRRQARMETDALALRQRQCQALR